MLKKVSNLNKKPTYEELELRLAALDVLEKTSGHQHDIIQLMQSVIDKIPQYIFWKDWNSVYLGCNDNFARAAGVENPSDILKFYDILKTDWKLDINKGNLLVLPANIFKIDVLLCSLKKLLSREKITRVFIDEIPLAFEKKVKISGNINKMLKALKKNEISSFFTTTISKKEDVLTLGNISFLKLTDNIAVMRRMEKGNDIVNFITILKVRGSIHDAKSREIRLTKEGLEIYAGKKESDGEQIPDVLPVSDLSYYIWHFSPEDERINKIVKGFCLKNTNINVCRVERDKQTDIGEFYFDSNHDFLGIIGKYITTPDTSLGLVCLPYGKVYQYAGEGMLMNVDSFIDKSDYLEESVESCSYNDKLYGVPFTVGCKSLMYRKDLLEKYKINVPETWDELMNAEQYILNKENDPALQGVSFQWEETEEIVSIFLGFIWGNNGDIFDSRSNIIADERIISALDPEPMAALLWTIRRLLPKTTAIHLNGLS